MKKFNKFTDEASYTSFIQNIAEPGYYTSWVVGNYLNIGDDIYSDGTNFYNYAKEGTELIGSYCGNINETYYIQALKSIYTGYFLTLDGFHEEMPYPENISSYNSYNNIPYLVRASSEYTGYRYDIYDIYKHIDVKSEVLFGNLLNDWEGWYYNYYTPGAEHLAAGDKYITGYNGEWTLGEDRRVYYPNRYWYVESNYRAWGIERLLEYRKTTGLNWEIPSYKLDLGNNIFYYESAANTYSNTSKNLIPVLPVEKIHTLLLPFHYDYVEELLHIYSENTIAIEEHLNNFNIIIIPDISNEYKCHLKFNNLYIYAYVKTAPNGTLHCYPNAEIYTDDSYTTKASYTLVQYGGMSNVSEYNINKIDADTKRYNRFKIDTYTSTYTDKNTVGQISLNNEDLYIKGNIDKNTNIKNGVIEIYKPILKYLNKELTKYNYYGYTYDAYLYNYTFVKELRPNLIRIN